ncbi:MAG: hypothetical protein IT328_23785 [Caldilineaceae bacterium]|nr:hypothetical protein [Caldilineaceae bacterium]
MTNVVRVSNPALIRGLDREFEKRTAYMRYNTEIAKTGMAELGELHSYAEYVALRTLSDAERLNKALAQDDLGSAAQNHAFHVRRQQFLDHLSQITGRAGRQIVLDILDMPEDQEPGAFVRALEGFFGR